MQISKKQHGCELYGLKRTCTLVIHTNLWKFAYPQFTGYAEYIWFCHKEHLNQILALTVLGY